MSALMDELVAGVGRMTRRALPAMGLVVAMMLAVLPHAAQAAPRFQGLRQALPAPGAALLIWDRAVGQGDIKYRV